MDILIIKPSSIGDVVHTLPALAAIRRLHPEAYITWLVEEESYNIIEGHPGIDQIIVSKRKGWLRNLRNCSEVFGTLREISLFAKEIRKRRYHLVIDLQGLFKSGLLVRLAKGKRKVGYDKTREFSYLFLNERIRPFNPDKHAVLRYLNLAKYLGADDVPVDFHIALGKGEKEYVDNIIDGSKQPIISINPMARWKTKQWSHRRFAELADKIHQQLGTTVLLTGGKGDIEDVARIQSYMTCKALSVVGKTTLKELAYLFRHSQLVISTDSGPMHIAAAVGTPVIALFGPTSPLRTGPFGDGHVVIKKHLPCSPCFRKRCRTVDCMQQITVRDVFSEIKKRF
jgi:heptosyltransferase-1